MSIWRKAISLERLNAMVPGSMLEATGTCFCEFGDDYLTATMAVTNAVRQPMGLLHGGASAALAESLGSIGGYFACPDSCYVVGTSISANHLRSMKAGTVRATARPIHIGGTLQLWGIDIVDDERPERLICRAQLSVMVRRH